MAKDSTNKIWTIESLDEFKAFRDEVNAGETFSKWTIKLETYIDLNNEEWTPIGGQKIPETNKYYEFQGNFDGQGHTIKNLYIKKSVTRYTADSNVGLFGRTTNGSVKNLTLENVDITGGIGVGAVCGNPYTSSYSNINVIGDVKVLGFAYVGGILGRNVYANLTSLTVNANEGSYVKAESGIYRSYVGGVVGFLAEGYKVIQDVSSNINVYGSTQNVGGLFGNIHFGNYLVDCTCTAKEIAITGCVYDEASCEEIGGIAGTWVNTANNNVAIVNCTVSPDTKLSATLLETDDNGETVERDVSDLLTDNTIVGQKYYPDSDAGKIVSSILYVDSTFTGKEGDLIPGTVEKYFGVTAFNNAQDAADAVADETSEIQFTDGVYVAVEFQRSVSLRGKATINTSLSEGFRFYTDGENSAEYTIESGSVFTVDSISLRAQTADGEKVDDLTVTLNVRGTVKLEPAKAADREIWVRKNTTLNLLKGGRINNIDQISNRGTIVVSGAITANDVSGNGSLSLAGADENQAGKMDIIGGSITINGVKTITDGDAPDITNGTVTISQGGKLVGAKSELDIRSAKANLVVNNGAVQLAGVVNKGTVTAEDATLSIDKLDTTAGTFTIAGACKLTMSLTAGSTIYAKDDTTLSGSITLATAATTRDDNSGLIQAEGDITVDGLTLGEDVILQVGKGKTLNIVVDADKLAAVDSANPLDLLNHVELDADTNITITVEGMDEDGDGVADTFQVTDEGNVLIDGVGYTVKPDESGKLSISFLEGETNDETGGSTGSDFVEATLTDLEVVQGEDNYTFTLKGTYTANSDLGATLILTVTSKDSIGTAKYYEQKVNLGDDVETYDLSKLPFSFSIATGDEELELKDLVFTITIDGKYTDADHNEVLDEPVTVTIKDVTAPTAFTASIQETNTDCALVTWTAADDNVGVDHYLVTLFDGEGQAIGDSIKVAADETELWLTGLENKDGYYVKVTAVDTSANETDATTGTFDIAAESTYDTSLDKDEYPLFLIGNFDGDAAADVLTVTPKPDSYDPETEKTTPHADVAAILNNGDGTAFKKGDVYWDVTDWKVVGTGDINGDGIDEALIWYEHGNGGDQGVNDIAAITLGSDGKYTHVDLRGFDTAEWEVMGVGDLNGDGREEIITCQLAKDNTGSDREYRQVLAWTFYEDGLHKLDLSIRGLNADWEILGIGDVMRTSKEDDYVILQNTNNGTISCLEYDGDDSNFIQFTLGTVEESVNWDFIGAGDFNGDGRDDLLWHDDETSTLYWSNTAQRCETLELGSSADDNVAGMDIAGIGDFNGDGKDDILWTSAENDKLAWSNANADEYNKLNNILA